MPPRTLRPVVQGPSDGPYTNTRARQATRPLPSLPAELHLCILESGLSAASFARCASPRAPPRRVDADLGTRQLQRTVDDAPQLRARVARVPPLGPNRTPGRRRHPAPFRRVYPRPPAEGKAGAIQARPHCPYRGQRDQRVWSRKLVPRHEPAGPVQAEVAQDTESHQC